MSEAASGKFDNIRLPDSKAEYRDGVTRVHLQSAVDGELRRAAQVGAEGRLGDMGLGDGGEDREQLGSSEHHADKVCGRKLQGGGSEGGEEGEVAEANAGQCSGTAGASRTILAPRYRIRQVVCTEGDK